MYYRRKILLAILQAWGDRLPGPDLQNILFLFSRRQRKPTYEFVPYKFGCISWQSHADKSAMVKYGQLKDEEEWAKADDADFLEQVDLDDRREIFSLKESIGGSRGEDLERRIYREYPYYASKSELAKKILSKAELKRVRDAAPKDSTAVLFTIGYEGKSFDEFLNCLVASNIKVLCDVRKNPLSMKYGFSKSQLKAALTELQIQYLHFPGLGIESAKRKNLSSAQDYKQLFDAYEKSTLPKSGAYIGEIIATLETEKRIALMCFENDPSMCHRGRLAKAIENHPGFRHSIIHLGSGDAKKGSDQCRDFPR